MYTVSVSWSVHFVNILGSLFLNVLRLPGLNPVFNSVPKTLPRYPVLVCCCPVSKWVYSGDNRIIEKVTETSVCSWTPELIIFRRSRFHGRLASNSVKQRPSFAFKVKACPRLSPSPKRVKHLQFIRKFGFMKRVGTEWPRNEIQKLNLRTLAFRQGKANSFWIS